MLIDVNRYNNVSGIKLFSYIASTWPGPSLQYSSPTDNWAWPLRNWYWIAVMGRSSLSRIVIVSFNHSCTDGTASQLHTLLSLEVWQSFLVEHSQSMMSWTPPLTSTHEANLLIAALKQPNYAKNMYLYSSQLYWEYLNFKVSIRLSSMYNEPGFSGNNVLIWQLMPLVVRFPRNNSTFYWNKIFPHIVKLKCCWPSHD